MLACVALQIPGHVASDQYGKYGIIRESDLASKISEFQQWATEVKRVDIEALAKWEEKELFAEFMEDYNTGTLPHRKYYDLMAYAQQQAMKAAKKGKTAGVRADLNSVPSGSAWTSVDSASHHTKPLRFYLCDFSFWTGFSAGLACSCHTPVWPL